MLRPSPVVKISLSSAGRVGSIPGPGAKTPRALWPKNLDIIQRNIITNSIKALKVVHIKKI